MRRRNIYIKSSIILESLKLKVDKKIKNKETISLKALIHNNLQ